MSDHVTPEAEAEHEARQVIKAIHGAAIDAPNVHVVEFTMPSGPAILVSLTEMTQRETMALATAIERLKKGRAK